MATDMKTIKELDIIICGTESAVYRKPTQPEVFYWSEEDLNTIKTAMIENKFDIEYKDSGLVYCGARHYKK